MRLRATALSVAFAALSGAAAGAAAARGELRIVAVHPHDPSAFTQGLVWDRGRLFESLGGYGESSLREVDLGTGAVRREVALPRHEFGEGLALVGDRLVQLTWREGVARIWRRDDFAPAGTFRYSGEGWGLTYDGSQLVQSDGSSTLTFRDAADFTPRRTVNVVRDGRPAPYLNELEWADGAIYANVWQSEEILRVDSASGQVTAVFDASGLLAPDERIAVDVLNGIAWNPDTGRFYLTGKRWPKLFEVELRAP